MNPTLSFSLLAMLLVAATLAALVPGLWRHDGQGVNTGTEGRQRTPDAGVAVLREQLDALDRDVATARVDAATAQRLRTEIGRRSVKGFTHWRPCSWTVPRYRPKSTSARAWFGLTGVRPVKPSTMRMIATIRITPMKLRTDTHPLVATSRKG